MMTVYLVIPLPKVPCVHRIYMVLANPSCLPRPHLVEVRLAVFTSKVNIRTRVEQGCRNL